jgi:hypothetical protein
MLSAVQNQKLSVRSQLQGGHFMRRFLLTVILLLSLALPAQLMALRHKVKEYKYKETAVDMSKMQRIFIGRINLPTEEGALYGYEKADWIELMAALNQKLSRCVLDRDVTVAKDKDDVNAAGYDLYIKFQDVNIDYEYYHLIVGIHFVDPKTNAEITMIPARPYYGNDWGFKGFMNAALNKVCEKVQVEVTGESQEKKKK